MFLDCYVAYWSKTVNAMSHWRGIDL